MPDQIRLANDAADLAARDAYLEANAEAFDAIFPGFGDVLRELWRDLRPLLTPCDCPLDPYHRWNCDLTPIWAQLTAFTTQQLIEALRAPREDQT